MNKRKTVDLEYLVDKANTILAQSTGSAEFRFGICTMVESALMESNRYKGFGYLQIAEVPKGELPGIRLDDHGVPMSRWVQTDDTRRKYFFAGDKK